jgi:DNA-binding NarL/FixJ family response regulator
MGNFLIMSIPVLPSRSIKVLIVEPISYWRGAGLTIVLSQDPGITCIASVECASEALQVITCQCPDILITATELPDRSGIQLIQEARHSSPRLKAILLSNKPDSDEILIALSHGISGYCFKGVSDTRLREIIKSVHEGAVWVEGALVGPVFSHLTSCWEAAQDMAAFEALPLTDWEREVLVCITKGYTNDEIAQRLGISVHTAKAHVCNVLNKLDVSDRVQAAVKATRGCLIT